jgi:hypothetical protein
MTANAASHHCPSCEARFAFRTELEDHLALDHPRPLDDDIAELEEAPHALVVFESMFGNTRIVAEAVAAGLASGAKVELVEVGEAPTALDPGLDLLVVGAPTHAFGLSRPETRAEAADEATEPLVSQGPGLREWLEQLDYDGAKPRVAAFATRVRHVPGSAARAAIRTLRRRGLAVTDAPASFWVNGKHGPLVGGEQERAERWGEQLACSARRQGG